MDSISDQSPTAATPTSVVIERRLRDVFAFAADCTRLPRWFSNVLAVAGDSSTRPGSVYHITVEARGARVRSTLEVTAFQADRHIGLRAQAGPWRVDGRFLFETVGTGTRVTFVPDMHLVDGSLGTARLTSDIAASLVRLRRLLEDAQPY